jgi:[acyl-carrier-protein] S-malonyltransferase
LRVAAVFPGQGTQSPGMGAPWRDHDTWSVVERAEKALGEPLGHLLLDADAAELGRTRASQLSVLLTSLVAWEACHHHLPVVVAYAGHSLGQVTALIASHALPFEDGIRFAARRAELTQAAADAHPGRMIALVGASPEQAERACDGTTSWIANHNADGQVVIAGTPDGVAAAARRAQADGVRRALPLDVGGAFHTPLMADATAGLADALAPVELSVPAAPVVSNDDARAYDDGEGWRERLAVHPTRPVRWADSMRTLAALGAGTFVEIGHGSMIAGVARRTVADVTVVGVATPDDIPRLQELHR